MSITLISLPAAINHTLQILSKIRSIDKKKIITDEALANAISDSKEMKQLAETIKEKLTVLKAWKHIHNVSTKILLEERFLEIGYIRSGLSGFTKKVCGSDQQRERLKDGHQKMKTGSFSIMTLIGMDYANFPAIEQKGLLAVKDEKNDTWKKYDTWQSRCIEFSNLADKFYGLEGIDRIPSSDEAAGFFTEAREFKDFVVMLNHLSDDRIKDGVDQIINVTQV